MNPRALSTAVFHLVFVTLVPIWVTAASRDTTRFDGDIGVLFGPVTDTCAFELTLWTATAGGSQIGPVIERELRVRGGLYDVELDFGPEALEDGSRYLQVAVGCPAGAAELTTLTRRAFLPGSTSRSGLGPEGMLATHGAGARPKAALGTAFTYQGELQQSGSPVTGSGDFQFSLWDALQGGAQIGATVPVNAVAVDNGRFTAQLDFGAAAFDGEARWLEIAVDYPSGAGSFTTLSPRQPLSAAPYALQTRGIFVDDAGEVGVGTTNPQAPLHVLGDTSQTLKVRNDAASGGIALAASASADTGWATAIDAYTASPGGVGVYAFNEAETGNAYGVQAETASIDGVAISGIAWNDDSRSTGIGVYGRSEGDYDAAGVYGEATASGGTSYGVHGVAATGSGVYGKNAATDNRGWLGTSSAGVAGRAAGAADYAGYFTGGRSYFEGHVGIGTDTPIVPLHVGGDTLVDGEVSLSSGHGITFGASSNRIYHDVNDLRMEADDDVFIEPDGDLFIDHTTLVVDGFANRVGIGTSFPAATLDVSGDIRTDGDYEFSSSRVFTRNLRAHSFRHGFHPSSDDIWISNDTYGYVESGVAPFGVALTAQLHLPDGAELQEFRVYFQDRDPGNNVYFRARITRLGMETGSGSNLSVIEHTTSGSSTSMASSVDYPAWPPVIQNSSNSYTINIYWLPDNGANLLRFYGCKVVYEISTMNP